MTQTQATVNPDPMSMHHCPRYALLPSVRLVGRPSHLTILSGAGSFPALLPMPTDAIALDDSFARHFPNPGERGRCFRDGSFAEVSPGDLAERFNLAKRTWLCDSRSRAIAMLANYRVDDGALLAEVAWRDEFTELDGWVSFAVRVDLGASVGRGLALWADLVEREDALPSWIETFGRNV